MNPDPDKPRSEGRDRFPICEQFARCAQSVRKECLTLYFFWFLDLCVCSHCRRFSPDCAPHVRPIYLPKLSTHGHCQPRHLEQAKSSRSDSDQRMGDQRYIPHSM